MKKLIPIAMILLLAGALIYISGWNDSKPCTSRSGTCLKSGGCCNPNGNGTCCKKTAPKCCGKDGKCCKMPPAPGSVHPPSGGGCGGCGS